MNWRLLDIRTGRANRQQFWLALLIVTGVNYSLRTIDPILQWPALIISLYIFMLIIIRRMHDMNMDAEDGLMIHKEEPTHRNVYMLMRVPYSCPYPLLILWSLFASGNKLKNEYGYPPEGLSFKSMIADDYSDKQKQEA